MEGGLQDQARRLVGEQGFAVLLLAAAALAYPVNRGGALALPAGGDVCIAIGAKALSERRCLQPGRGEAFRDCGECPEMVVVPAGAFMMGSRENEEKRDDDESPRHEVVIAAPFAIGKFAIRVAEWESCVAGGGCGGYRPIDRDATTTATRGDMPVVGISWHDARAYANWISQKTGKLYRLPTEAEREYVTRAGTTTPYWLGTSISRKQANYLDNPSLAFSLFDPPRPVPVEAFQPNPWGLYQVHGNVYEWVEDCYNHLGYTAAPADGSAWTASACNRRALRGGSFMSGAWALRSSSRNGLPSDNRANTNGLRLVRPLD